MSAYRRWAPVCIAVLAILALGACGGSYPQSSLTPNSDVAWKIQHLFSRIFWLAAVVFVVVEGALLFAVIRFRERPGRPRPRPVHGNTVLEIGWTLAPAIVLVLIAVPTIRTIWEVDRPPPGDVLRVDVIGHQWWWEFRYPELGVVTANEIHVPVGRTVDLHLTSGDVVHSFWMPRVAGKRDVVPGHENRLWFTVDSAGTYSGQCAEFCGLSHALMGMRMIAQEPGEFGAWVERMRLPSTTPDGKLAAEGRELFLRSACIGCHTVRGTPAAGVLGPDLTHVGARGTIGAGLFENTPAERARWLRDPPAVKPGVKMPNLNLDEDQIARLSAYLGSLR